MKLQHGSQHILSTHLVPSFSDSLHGWLIECWIVVDV